MDSKKINSAAKNGWKYVGIGAASLVCGGILQATEVLKFSNESVISISAGLSGPAAPYPSTISTLFPKGKISSISVTLEGLNHANPDDLDVLLVGPNGAAIILMSDAGANFAIANANVTFSDTASPIPNATQIATGTYGPANYESTPDVFSAPAPAAVSGSALSVFKGLNPTGNWSLYVYDDADNNGGLISGGWSIRMVVDQPPVPEIEGGSTNVAVKQSVVIKGTAKDDQTRVTQVFVRVNNGPLKLAKGRNKWSIKAKLRVGTNKIRVYAADTVGNLSAPTVQRIIRLPFGTVL